MSNVKYVFWLALLDTVILCNSHNLSIYVCLSADLYRCKLPDVRLTPVIVQMSEICLAIIIYPQL